jgi:hypothetical protein
MSGNIKDQFEDCLKPYTGNNIKGIVGGLKIEATGTFIFAIQDDSGVKDVIRIPNSLYVPGLDLPLLSPQHWAQEAKDNFPVKHGKNVLTDEDGCTIVLKQKTRKKKVLHDPLTNTSIFRTASRLLHLPSFRGHLHRP